jgi:hypothetical protein
VRLILGYTGDRWECDMNAQAVSGTNMLRSLDGGVTQSTFPVNGYTSLASRVGYKIDERWTASLSGTNLSQAKTTESPFPAIQRLVLFAVTARL